MKERMLIVVRHGETDWNRDSRYQGQIDIELNALGREQARELGLRLSKRPEWLKDSLIVSSDLRRARQTAEIAMPNAQIAVDPDLREMRYGVFEGLTRAQIESRFPEMWRRWNESDLDFVMEGGESRRAARDRTIAAVERWLLRSTQRFVIVVTHGGVMRQLVQKSFADEMPTQISYRNTCVHLISVLGPEWTYAGMY